jgi:hypothetical protein
MTVDLDYHEIWLGCALQSCCLAAPPAMQPAVTVAGMVLCAKRHCQGPPTPVQPPASASTLACSNAAAALDADAS